MTIDMTLQMSKILIGWVCLLQSLELLLLHQESNSVWCWSILRKDYLGQSRLVQILMSFLFGPKIFAGLLILRIPCALALPFFTGPWILLFLLMSTSLIALRWRGSFNGGSDFMTVTILSALTAASFSTNPVFVTGCLWYIGIQTCASYFIAGFVKICKPSWRTGVALKHFMTNSVLGPPKWLSRLHSDVFQIATWFFLAFELSFPLCLANPSVCAVYLALAFHFHLANFYFFGLNRFVWAWLAAYPSVMFCSATIGKTFGVN